MPSGPDVRTLMRSEAGRLDVGDPPVRDIVRRGRRRLLVRRVGAALSAAIALAAFAWSTSQLLSVGHAPRRPVAPAPVPGPKVIRVFDTGLVFGLAVAAMDGSVWVSGREGHVLRRVIRLDARTGRRIDTLRMPDQLDQLLPFRGSIWGPGDGRLVRITPEGSTGDVVKTYPVPGTIAAMTAGEGSLWLLTSGPDAVVLRFDPETGRSGPIALPPGLAGHNPLFGPQDIAIGNGAVWVTGGGTGLLLRIDPVTLAVRTLHATPAARRTGPDSASGAILDGVAAGGGKVWVCCDEQASVIPIDPATGRQAGDSFRVPDFGEELGLLFADGHLWTFGFAFDGVPQGQPPGSWLYRIDPATDRIEGPLAEPAAGAASTSDGYLWSVDEFDGTLVRMRADAPLPETTLPPPGREGRSAVDWIVVVVVPGILGLALVLMLRRRARSVGSGA